MQRPRRKRKADRLLVPGAGGDEIQCDYAIGPMDRLATEMERKWGIDRLPELVTPELATRYGAAMAYLNECLEENDPAKCAAAAANCMRGLKAMDAEATRLGRQPASGAYVEGEVDGFKFGILHDAGEWQQAQDARPDLKFFTIREAGIALKMKMDAGPIAQVKELFPGAQVTAHRRPPLSEVLDDEIPF